MQSKVPEMYHIWYCDQITLKLRSESKITAHHSNLIRITNAERTIDELESIELTTCMDKRRIFNAEQREFKLEKCLNNLMKLSDHFIGVFRKLHDSLRVFQFLTKMADFRCNMIAFHLIMWNLFAIFAPEKIKIDVFDFMCIKGGGFM